MKLNVLHQQTCLNTLHLKVCAMCIRSAMIMPKHYSADLWWTAAVWLVLLWKMSYNEAGDILFMSIRRYVDQYQSTGDVDTHMDLKRC